MKNDTAKSPSLRSILIAHNLSIVGFLGAAFFPDHRMWGFNWWGYFPLSMPLKYLRQLAATTGLRPEYFVQAADVYAEAGSGRQALEALQLALEKGLDSSTFRDLSEKYRLIEN